MPLHLGPSCLPDAAKCELTLLYVICKGHLEELCEAVKNKDSFAARRWSKGEQWSTVIQLMQAANGKQLLVDFYAKHRPYNEGQRVETVPLNGPFFA